MEWHALGPDGHHNFVYQFLSTACLTFFLIPVLWLERWAPWKSICCLDLREPFFSSCRGWRLLSRRKSDADPAPVAVYPAPTLTSGRGCHEPSSFLHPAVFSGFGMKDPWKRHSYPWTCAVPFGDSNFCVSQRVGPGWA